MAKKTPKKDKKPKVHKDLEGFDIQLNEFGEIETKFNIEKINEFLDENVKDKKLTDNSILEEE